MGVGCFERISTYKHIVVSNFTKHSAGMCTHYAIGASAIIYTHIKNLVVNTYSNNTYVRGKYDD